MLSNKAVTRRLILTGALALVWSAGSSSPVLAQKAVIVVRHAERADESQDSLLSATGTARAEALARHLKQAGVTSIYVTQYQRTRLTAAPLAAALGVTPIVVAADATKEMVDGIRRDRAADVVLIVGHSNTVPTILTLFGHPDTIAIKPDEFDNLFIVVPRPEGAPTVVRLRYWPL